MDGDAWAAWAQAVGSILAIVAAIWISDRQHKSSLKVFKAQRRDAKVSKLEVLFALAEQTRTLIEKVNAAIQGDLANYLARELDSNDLRGLHEAFAAVRLQDLPSGKTVFAILRLKEASGQMPDLVQRAVDDMSEQGGLSHFIRAESEDLRQATNWAYIQLREECAAAEEST